MSPEILTWLWLIAGLLLCGSEFFVPALLSIFLGLSALGVAALRFLGLIEGMPASFAVWIVSSMFMVVALRRLAQRFVSSDRKRANINEQAAEFGQAVEVLDDVTEEQDVGRIRFQGTTWPAMTTNGTIKKGEKARIVYRDNLHYVIEADPEAKLLDATKSETVPALKSSKAEVS